MENRFECGDGSFKENNYPTSTASSPADSSIEAMLKLCTSEKEECLQKFKQLSEVFLEAKKEYKLVQENVIKCEKSYKLLVDWLKNQRPSLKENDFHVECEFVHQNGELNDSKSLEDFKHNLMMLMNKLLSTEESFEKHFDAFKQGMEQTLPSISQNDLKKRYHRWVKKLSVDLDDMRTEREDVAMHWSQTTLFQSTSEEDTVKSSQVCKQNEHHNKINDDQIAQSFLNNSEILNEFQLNSGKETNEIMDIEDFNIVDEEERQSDKVSVKKHVAHRGSIEQNLLGKSLPVIEDTSSFVDDDVFKSKNEIVKRIFCASTPDMERTQFGSLMNEMESKPITSYNEGSLGIGNHFLVPEATLVTDSQEDFKFSIGFSTEQKQSDSSHSLDSRRQLPCVTCSFCQTTFLTVKLLEAHLLLNHSPKLCRLCLFVGADIIKLQHHVAENHNLYKVCMFCGEVQDEKSFISHKASHHKNPLRKTGISKRKIFPKFKGSVPKKKCLRQPNYHMFYTCDFCEHLSASRYEMQRHKNEHILERLKKYICKVCCRHFDCFDKLTKHLKSSHMMEENKLPDKICCIICYYAFDEPSKLIEHMKHDHQHDSMITKANVNEGTGVDRDKCTNCDVYLKNSKVRAIHTIIHHGSAPYVCACKAQFYNKGMLDHHVLNHTKAEEEKFQVESKKLKKLENKETKKTKLL